jgi:hypothetical protein
MSQRHRIGGLVEDLRALAALPVKRVDLMLSAASRNDPFYGQIVREYWRQTRRRHPRFPVLRRETHGVALCELPSSFDEYFAAIEGSARRNHRKAARTGHEVREFAYRDHRDDVHAIVGSSSSRQGQLPPDFMGEVLEHANPSSIDPTHAYRHFGVFRDGALLAFADLFVAGEVAMLTTILGHAGHQSDGIVPQLIIEMARRILNEHPTARFYTYGTYFGASEGLRRFKRRFRFSPHRIEWVLGDRA